MHVNDQAVHLCNVVHWGLVHAGANTECSEPLKTAMNVYNLALVGAVGAVGPKGMSLRLARHQIASVGMVAFTGPRRKVKDQRLCTEMSDVTFYR